MCAAEISPTELKNLVDSGIKLILLDVRQPQEHELVRIDGSVLIPLMELEERLDEVRELCEQGVDLICYSRSGGRSGKAVEILESAGIKGFRNLKGGINTYAKEADKTLTPY